MPWVGSNGYVYMKGKQGSPTLLVHRVVMEKKLGRPLESGEVVHHKDHDRMNNDPENLELVVSQSEHNRMHGRPCEPGCTCRRHTWREEQ